MIVAFLSQPWAGLLISITIFLIGAAALRIGSHRGSRFAKTAGLATGGLGFLLGVGLLIYLIGQQRALGAYKAPPGAMVDMGGYDMHVWCEGPVTVHPTILWISGGYSQGLHLFHLHKAMAAETRSCLVDRAGTGWSERAPTPRTVKNITMEFHDALAAAGEDGPFLVVGHSLGGQIGANFAARFPAETAGLIALDGTPQTLIAASGHGPEGWCGAPFPSLQVFGTMFGLGYALPFLNPLNTPEVEKLHAPLMEVWEPLKAMEARPRTLLATYQAFQQSCLGGYEVIRLPGALGDLPVLSIVQPENPNTEEVLANARKWQAIEAEFEVANWRRVAVASSREYADYSLYGELIYAPKGTGHMFPLEDPDFTLEQVRAFMKRLIAN